MTMKFEDIEKIANPAVRKQLLEAYGKNEKKPQAKMGNVKVKTTVGGVDYTFDSKLEFNYFKELKLKERAGLISNLEVQPKFDLIPTMEHDGETLRKITYISDFKYDEDGKTYVVDTKGHQTDVYKIKKRLFLMMYPQYIFKEVFNVKTSL